MTLTGTALQRENACAIRERWARTQNWRPLDDASTAYHYALMLAVAAPPFNEAAAWIAAARAGDLDRQIRQKADRIYESHRRATIAGLLDPVDGTPIETEEG